MKYFIVPKYKNPKGKTTARNQGVAKATVAIVAEHDVATDNHIAKVTGSSSSMVYKSFENKLTNRPNGVRSKKAIGAFSSPSNIWLCNERAAFWPSFDATP